jgi:hypothetical protein
MNTGSRSIHRHLVRQEQTKLRAPTRGATVVAFAPMPADVLVFGDLKFPPGFMSEWRKAPYRPSTFPDAEPPFVVRAAGTPFEAFHELDLVLDVSGWSRVRWEKDRVELRAQLPHATYLELCAPVTAGFRLAADFGASGELVFVDSDGAFASRIIVRKGKSSQRTVGGRALTKILGSQEVAQVRGAVHARRFVGVR